ncbi:MAG: hypothetical protein IK024_12990 [Treponema sp.]|nr:hypothetical protein [Treponema sp.]
MSDFLFAKPTTIDGVMSIVDLFGIVTEYNDSSSEKAADARAIRADITAIRKDFVDAYTEEIENYA